MSATKAAAKQSHSPMQQIGEESKTAQSSLDTSFAALEDLPDVAQMCASGMEELKEVLPLKLSAEKLLDSIVSFWANAPCFLLKKNGETIGFYGLTAYVPFYTEEAILGDYMLYVLPEHRSYKALRKLSLAAQEFAKGKQMALDLNFVTPAKARVKARFLEDMGAKIIGVKAVYDGR